MAALQPGDLLQITRLDRLARSTLHLLTMLDRLDKVGVGFKSLADGWCDTTTPHGKLFTVIFAGLAEFERELIMARTREGISKARADGVKFGRKPKLSRFQRGEALARLAAGETATAIAKTYGVSYMTICRLPGQATDAGLAALSADGVDFGVEIAEGA